MYFERNGMGKRLKQVRTNLKLTQAQVAEKANISINHYGNLERGKCGTCVETLVKICNAFDVTLNYILLNKEDADNDSLHDKIKKLYPKQSFYAERMLHYYLKYIGIK